MPTLALAVCSLAQFALPAFAESHQQASIRLEWRPSQSAVAVGDTVDIGLYAISNSADPVPICGLQVILNWDAALLDGLTKIDPCSGSLCPPNTHSWSISEFPSTPLNDSLNDGDAYYIAFGCPTTDPALVTSEGLLVVIFRFTVLGVGEGELRFQAASDPLRTVVLDLSGEGQVPDLGPPARVSAISCPNPVVAAVGSRYLMIIPGAGDLPVALSIEGDSNDSEVSCVDRFVQQDGTIHATPVSQTPIEWGTVFVNDTEIIPSTSYTIRVDCGLPMGLDIHSDPIEVTTWLWGDVTGDDEVDQLDVAAVLDGADGIYLSGRIPENMDIAPCVGDGVVDSADVALVMAAFYDAPYPCVLPCRPLPDLAYLDELAGCMEGPGEPVSPTCLAFDTNVDHSVDIADFAEYQIAPSQVLSSGPRWLAK